jgi:hypothetical protein
VFVFWKKTKNKIELYIENEGYNSSVNFNTYLNDNIDAINGDKAVMSILDLKVFCKYLRLIRQSSKK